MGKQYWYRCEVIPGGKIIHVKLMHAAYATMRTFPITYKCMPHWNFFIWFYYNFTPFKLPYEDTQDHIYIPHIKYHIYEAVGHFTVQSQRPL